MKQFIKKHCGCISLVAVLLLVVDMIFTLAVGGTVDLPAALVGGCLAACPVLFFLSLLPFLFE